MGGGAAVDGAGFEHHADGPEDYPASGGVAARTGHAGEFLPEISRERGALEGIFWFINARIFFHLARRQDGGDHGRGLHRRGVGTRRDAQARRRERNARQGYRQTRDLLVFVLRLRGAEIPESLFTLAGHQHPELEFERKVWF